MAQRPYKYVPILAESTVPDTNLLSLPAKAGVGAYNLGARAVAGLANKFVDNRTEEQKYADSVGAVSRTMENIGSRPDSIRLGPPTPAGTVPIVSFAGAAPKTTTEFKPVPAATLATTRTAFDPTYPALDLYHGAEAPAPPDTGPTSHTEAPTVPVLAASGTGSAVPQFTERAPDVTARLAALQRPPSFSETVSSNLGSSGSALGILTALGIASKAAESNDAQYNNEVAQILAEGQQGIGRLKTAQDTFKLNTDVQMDLPYKEALTGTQKATAQSYLASAEKDKYLASEKGQGKPMTANEIMQRRLDAEKQAQLNIAGVAANQALPQEQYTALVKQEADRLFNNSLTSARAVVGETTETPPIPGAIRHPDSPSGWAAKDASGKLRPVKLQ